MRIVSALSQFLRLTRPALARATISPRQFDGAMGWTGVARSRLVQPQRLPVSPAPFVRGVQLPGTHGRSPIQRRGEVRRTHHGDGRGLILLRGRHHRDGARADADRNGHAPGFRHAHL